MVIGTWQAAGLGDGHVLPEPLHQDGAGGGHNGDAGFAGLAACWAGRSRASTDARCRIVAAIHRKPQDRTQTALMRGHTLVVRAHDAQVLARALLDGTRVRCV